MASNYALSGLAAMLDWVQRCVVDQQASLVVVLETNDQIQLAMAKGLLDDAGIPLFIEGQLATLYQPLDPFLRKWIRLQVPDDRATEARELLEPVQSPKPHLT